jgi:hypothetical protein
VFPDYSGRVGFLLLCAVIAGIMIAARLSARSRARPQAGRLAGAPGQVQTQAQAEAPSKPQVAARPAPDAPQAPPPATGQPTGVAADRAGEQFEPPSPLDILSPKVAHVPPELAARVIALMNKRQEVSAVRLLCDELRIGILDAQKTARSLEGR